MNSTGAGGTRHGLRAKRFAMRTLLLVVLVATGSWNARAAQGSLVISSGEQSHSYTSAALLARPDIATIILPYDVSYRSSKTYRAVPLLALLGGNHDGRFDTLEARAADGFIAQIPLDLIARGSHGGAVAWLAIEDPAQPWEALPHHTRSAGPFYLVWQNAKLSNIRSEQWPHWLVSLALVESPLHRWPQLELPSGRNADTPAARAGQKIFLSFCLPCHRLNGGGASDTGPDLGQPMSAPQYLTEAGLRAIIRDPRSVRTWPTQMMGGFGAKTLPDADVDNLLVYLRVMAAARASQP